MPVLKLDRRSVAALPSVQKPTVFYDDRLTGFGVRVMPGGSKSWILEYRPGSGGRMTPKRRLTLGKVSAALQADAARLMAKQHLARVVQGADPAAERSELRKAERVSDLLDAYLDDHVAAKRKAKSLVNFQVLARLHIKPAIGARPAALVTTADVARFHRRIGQTRKVTANRAVELLRAAYAYGIKSGLLPKTHDNPAASVDRYRESHRERLLSGDELARLGASLRLAETTGLPWTNDPDRCAKHVPKKRNTTVIDPYAIAAIRLLIFTGARLREILHLQWSEVDLERGFLRLPDSKTGAKVIVLARPAIEVLQGLKPIGRYVIAGQGAFGPDAGTADERPRSDLQRPWDAVRKHACIADVRLHDLRHAFASTGAMANLSLGVIGALLGHRSPGTTARYAHLAADPLRSASDLIAGALETSLSGRPS